jgi:hypothetical protein
MFLLGHSAAINWGYWERKSSKSSSPDQGTWRGVSALTQKPQLAEWELPL